MADPQRSTADDNLVVSLGQTAVNVIGSVIPPDRPLALLDFPRYSNVGDAAIWLGEINCLAECGISRSSVRYMCDISTYNESSLRRSIGAGGVILLHGGGNFGDIWPAHQQFREMVVAAFPNNPIVVLPQSIHFTSERALARASDVFNRHSNLTVLARDHASLDLLRKEFTTNSILCPDTAFCLGKLDRPVEVNRETVYLARVDKESRFSADTARLAVVTAVDWPSIADAREWQFGNALADFQVHHRRVAQWLLAPLQALVRTSYGAMATERLKCGTSLLGQGKVVVTDRLHAHILALLMGIPHVILDNSYGKIRRFHEAWTSDSTLVSFAGNVDEAFALAAGMLRNDFPETRPVRRPRAPVPPRR